MSHEPGIPVRVQDLNFGVGFLTSYSHGRSPHPCKLGSATGVFYQKEDKKYLITNRHVVVNEESSYYPDTIVVDVHNDSTVYTSIRSIAIPLYKDGKCVWIEHKDNEASQGEKIDIIAIEISDYISQSDLIRYFSSDDFPLNTEIVNLGDQCIAIGFPDAFHDTKNHLPIVRSGTVASTWGTHFKDKKIFLIDSILHSGTSGSPVFLPEGSFRRREKGMEFGNFPPRLIGINAGEFGGLNLNAVWYYYLIEEMLQKEVGDKCP